MSARLWLSFAFILIMGWLWYPHLKQQNTTQKNEQNVEVVPDYVAQGLKQTVFNEHGKLSHKVSAKQMEMYQELGFTHFSHPIFTIYSDEGSWQLSAAEATLYDDDRLILEQDVIAINLTPNAMLDKIAASKIVYLLNDKLMQSESAVTMTGPSIKIVGQGLNANLNTEVLDLINHTKTTYYEKQD